MSKHKLERCDKWRYNFRKDGQLLDGFLTADFNQVPKGFNSEGYDIGPEITLLVDDANKLSAYSEMYHSTSNRLIDADSSQSF